MSSVEVTTWYLEMKAQSQLRPAPAPSVEHCIERVQRPSAAFARFLYASVGERWHWTDRLSWSRLQWEAHLARPAVMLHTLQIGGAPAGYLELEQQPEGNVELAYFGLMPELLGRRWGGYLLTRAVELAWALPSTRRVWVHTCSLDSPHALQNYEARGFTRYDTRIRVCTIPPVASWPG
jgi:GNAT superfamily N-acetyltransferase